MPPKTPGSEYKYFVTPLPAVPTQCCPLCSATPRRELKEVLEQGRRAGAERGREAFLSSRAPRELGNEVPRGYQKRKEPRLFFVL